MISTPLRRIIGSGSRLKVEKVSETRHSRGWCTYWASLRVNRIEQCIAFYDQLMPFLGLHAGPWAPGYYSLSFRDPEGIRLELNHVPGTGLFAEGAAFDPAPDHPLPGAPRKKA